MTPYITKSDVDAMKRALFARPRHRQPGDRPDFKVRPISEAWRLAHRMPAYKTAVANVAYIWRDSTAADRFGPTPARFAERRCELHGAGLILPASAPVWAASGYTIWEEADTATIATGDPTAVSAWHVMMEIPSSIRPDQWRWLVIGFIERELAGRGAATAWAIHALEGDDDWIVRPHAHLIVSARHWRHGARQGDRHPAWIGSWGRSSGWKVRGVGAAERAVCCRHVADCAWMVGTATKAAGQSTADRKAYWAWPLPFQDEDDEHCGRRENAPAHGPLHKRKTDMTKTGTAPVQIRHQNWMLALRDLAGVPTFKPVNESILFCGTALNGLQSGMELARFAQKAERNVICAHWANTKAKRPMGYTIVLRNILSVDVLSDRTAYIWGEDRLALVSAREKLTIRVGDRGLL